MLAERECKSLRVGAHCCWPELGNCHSTTCNQVDMLAILLNGGSNFVLEFYENKNV